MQFLKLTVGDINSIFPEETAFPIDFTFDRPANSANVMLQGFDVRFAAPDHHLKKLKVGFLVHFHPGDRGGTIDLSVSLTDASPGFDPINLQVDLLVVGN